MRTKTNLREIYNSLEHGELFFASFNGFRALVKEHSLSSVLSEYKSFISL